MKIKNIIFLLIGILISSCNPPTNNDFSDLNLSESVSQIENSSNINDVKIYFHNQLLFNNSILNFSLRVIFNDSAKEKTISSENVIFDYNEQKLNISITSTSRLISNEFIYVIRILTDENICFSVKIDSFSKEFEYSCADGLIENSIYFEKSKLNTNVYQITPLKSLNEYNEFLNKVKLLSYLNPDQDFFNEYFIVVVPVTNSSSTIENNYINCFKMEGKIFFNFTSYNSVYESFDYHEDLFFIKINNKYLDSEFYKIITYI